jgi:hypothetical protein
MGDCPAVAVDVVGSGASGDDSDRSITPPRAGRRSAARTSAQVWQPTIPPFQEHGSPSEALQRSCAQAGLLAVDFPYTRGGYILHLGRGSLREIVATRDRANRHYQWATTHHEPHVALEADAPAAYAAFQAAFARDVPTLDAASLIRACR